MNKKLIFTVISFLMIFQLHSEPVSSEWGAGAASADKNLTIEDMLNYAVQDEYLARAEYEAIIGKFGSQKPFSNIIKSEERHIAWLKDAFKDQGLAMPADRAKEYIVVPASLKEAFQTGVTAEIENIKMYETFIASELINRPENSSLKSLFIRLRDASKNHLSAFKNGLARY